MKKTTANLVICAMVFVMALIVSNVVASKTIDTGVVLFGTEVVVPSAVICYCITFLVTDIVGELWGRKEAQLIVWGGFACQVLALVLIMIAQVLPAASADMQDAYTMLLGNTPVFVLASLLGYLVSQSWDVFIFHKIRDHFIAKGRSGAWRWVWNNASTMTSQMLDTLIYITIAFGVGMGWLFDPAMHATLAAMVVGQYCCKFVLAALDTPFFYFFTRKSADANRV